MIIAPILQIYTRLNTILSNDHKEKQQTVPVNMNLTDFRSYISDVMKHLF